MQPEIRVIAVTGMKAEAKLARGPGILVITSCGDSQTLTAKLDAAIKEHGARGDGKPPLGILSFGVAGGLVPQVSPGTTLIARRVIGPDGQTYPTDAEWQAYLASAVPGSKNADIAGVDLPVTSPREKAALFRHTGAFAVDMESHIAAKTAHERGLAFAAFRVIADCAEHGLPPAAQAGLTPDGSVALVAIARSILKRPSQIPALWRLAKDTNIAFKALSGSRQRAGEGFGFLDLG